MRALRGVQLASFFRDDTPGDLVKRAVSTIRAWLTASLLLLACAQGALAAPVPLVVERLGAVVPPGSESAVVEGAYDSDFAAEPWAAITPARDQVVWYRVRLARDWAGERQPLLTIADPQGLYLRAFVPPGYAGEAFNIYDRQPHAGFTRHALNVLLPATLAAGQPVYLRLEPARAVPRRSAVDTIADARVEDLARARLDILFPAVQLATLLVMLCFFLALRERTYLVFVGQVVLIVLYELYAFGIGFELAPFDLLRPLGAGACWLSGALATVLLIDFSRQFLELDRCTPRIDSLLGALRWPLLALAAFTLLPPPLPGLWLEDALSILLLLIAPTLLIGGLLAWQVGGRRGGFYLCAWVPGLLFIIVRTLQLVLHWPLPQWLEFALPAAFAYASVVLSFGLTDHTLSIRHERDVAHRLAEHDVLTGVLNRRAILARLRAAFLEAREAGLPLALLFIDLDHFKRINDSYGHRAGDQCLRAVIGPISSELRQGDALGRYGGEEFLVVLPGAAAPNAEVVAERIRSRVEEMPLLVSGTRIGITLSVGIAALCADVATPEDLIERADAALYRSKSAGRNLVSTHESPIIRLVDPVGGS